MFASSHEAHGAAANAVRGPDPGALLSAHSAGRLAEMQLQNLLPMETESTGQTGRGGWELERKASATQQEGAISWGLRDGVQPGLPAAAVLSSTSLGAYADVALDLASETHDSSCLLVPRYQFPGHSLPLLPVAADVPDWIPELAGASQLAFSEPACTQTRFLAP